MLPTQDIVRACNYKWVSAPSLQKDLRNDDDDASFIKRQTRVNNDEFQIANLPRFYSGAKLHILVQQLIWGGLINELQNLRNVRVKRSSDRGGKAAHECVWMYVMANFVFIV